MKSEAEFYGKEKFTFVLDPETAAGMRLISVILKKSQSEVVEDAIAMFLRSKPKLMAAIEELRATAEKNKAEISDEYTKNDDSSDVVDVREKDGDRS
jgi:predicted transcriptional regulator